MNTDTEKFLREFVLIREIRVKPFFPIRVHLCLSVVKNILIWN